MFSFHQKVFMLPASHRLGQLSIPQTPKTEVKYSLCIFGHQFCPEEGCNLPTNYAGLWLLSEQLMWSYSFTQLWDRRRGSIVSSMSMNYGRSSMSQMLAGLILQFSVLRFCFSKFQDRRKETTNEKQKGRKEKNGFPEGRPAGTTCPHSWDTVVIMCYKKLIYLRMVRFHSD
jgi:hypothetical protein